MTEPIDLWNRLRAPAAAVVAALMATVLIPGDSTSSWSEDPISVSQLLQGMVLIVGFSAIIGRQATASASAGAALSIIGTGVIVADLLVDNHGSGLNHKVEIMVTMLFIIAGSLFGHAVVCTALDAARARDIHETPPGLLRNRFRASRILEGTFLGVMAPLLITVLAYGFSQQDEAVWLILLIMLLIGATVMIAALKSPIAPVLSAAALAVLAPVPYEMSTRSIYLCATAVFALTVSLVLPGARARGPAHYRIDGDSGVQPRSQG